MPMTAVRPTGSNSRPRPSRAGLGSGRGGTYHVQPVAAAASANDAVDLGSVEAVALEKRLGHLVEDLEVVLQETLRAVVRLGQEAPELGVDLDRRLLGVVGGLREVAAEEDLLFLLAERHRSERFAH